MGFNPKEYVAIDTETTGLKPWHGDRPFAVSMCDEEGETWYCEWPVDPFTRTVTPSQEDVAYIRKFQSDSNITKIYHNAKFDRRMLEMIGIEFAGRAEDTFIAAKVANNMEPDFGLKPLAQRYIGIEEDDEEELHKVVLSVVKKAKAYNSAVDGSDFPKIKIEDKGEHYEDYWLPKYFDSEAESCEKYCTQDAFRTMGLWIMYKEVMEGDSVLAASYQDEMKLWNVVYKMETRGIRIRKDLCMSELKRAEEDRERYYNEMIKIIETQKLVYMEPGKPKKPFNPKSSKHLQKLLYSSIEDGGLALESSVSKKSGNITADKAALRKISGEQFVRDLSGYRTAQQAIKIYFQKYLDHLEPDEVSPGEDRLHPGLNQCGTTTFRFSCSAPNIQQAGNPRTATQHDGGDSYYARLPFGPRRNYVVYGFDYAQQELRLFAYIGQIPFLLEQIALGNDPNTACANKAWGGKDNPAAVKAAIAALDLTRTEPTTDPVRRLWDEFGWNSTAAREFGTGGRTQGIAWEWLARFNYEIVAAEKSIGNGNSRGRAKMVMFAKIFGGGGDVVKDLLYCSRQQADEFMNEYKVAMPEIDQFMQRLIKQGKKDGYLINPYGRKIRVQKELAYTCVNHIIQSTAACMMKDCMVRCDEFLVDSGLDAHIWFTMHDELMFEIRKEHSYRWLLRGIQAIMEDNQGRIGVPMPVDGKRFVHNWAEKEEIKEL